MHTVEGIMSAAASLSGSDLGRLRREIDLLEKRANALVFKTRRGITFRLCRLRDAEHWELARRSLAIEEDYGFYLRFYSQMRDDREQELTFPQVYLTLKNATGESSDDLDDYKMAFSFPFALDVIKKNGAFAYLLEIRNIRDSLYFTLRKLVAPDDERLKDHRVHEPLENEFGREEINYFISYLHGYLTGRWETLAAEPHEPFVKRVPSNLILFGYCAGKVFEEEYDSTEEFDAAWRRYEQQVKKEQDGLNSADECLVLNEGVRRHGTRHH